MVPRTEKGLPMSTRITLDLHHLYRTAELNWRFWWLRSLCWISTTFRMRCTLSIGMRVIQASMALKYHRHPML